MELCYGTGGLRNGYYCYEVYNEQCQTIKVLLSSIACY